MYGQIHVVFKQMVLAKYGPELWNKILSQGSLDGEEDFLQFKNYPDETFCRMIASITTCVGESLNEVLEDFGEFFIKYCLACGYDTMLRTLGGDMVSFIQNLDSLHSLLSLTYKGINPPSFRCEPSPDGGLLLHYYSCRSGLYSLVVGLLRAAGTEIFGHDVQLTHLLTVEENLGPGKSQEHTVCAVHFPQMLNHNSPRHNFLVPQAPGSQSPTVHVGVNNRLSHDKTANHSSPAHRCPSRDTSKYLFLTNGLPRPLTPSPETYNNHGWFFPTQMHTNDNILADTGGGGITLSGRQFCRTFPYHVFFDSQLTIVQCGDALRRLLPVALGPGNRMEEAFEIQYPRVAWSLDNIRSFLNAMFILTLRNAQVNGVKNQRRQLHIKGQMLWLAERDGDDQGLMMFIGSPSVKSLKEMKEVDLYMSDIPLFDVTREIILLYEQRNAEIGITQRLDHMTAELQRTSQALETERQKTEELLHQMLPPRVALQLKDGHSVEAETYEAATVMFSDVVTFTTIAASCPPEKIVNMLNDMYERFDNATTRWNVYKVETIGDAYMVVGGVPERSSDHAQRVGFFAMDILQRVNQVPSPATGQPLQIRVGIHTGSVMAGVVGIKMPRYCLFGDTVNTAARMESHGVPGRIHTSPETYRCLASSPNFFFKLRGTITVKGKGAMTTYFLTGLVPDVTVLEPDDEFAALPYLEGDVKRHNSDFMSIVDKKPTDLDPFQSTVVTDNKGLDNDVINYSNDAISDGKHIKDREQFQLESTSSCTETDLQEPSPISSTNTVQRNILQELSSRSSLRQRRTAHSANGGRKEADCIPISNIQHRSPNETAHRPPVPRQGCDLVLDPSAAITTSRAGHTDLVAESGQGLKEEWVETHVADGVDIPTGRAEDLKSCRQSGGGESLTAGTLSGSTKLSRQLGQSKLCIVL